MDVLDCRLRDLVDWEHDENTTGRYQSCEFFGPPLPVRGFFRHCRFLSIATCNLVRVHEWGAYTLQKLPMAGVSSSSQSQLRF